MESHHELGNDMYYIFSQIDVMSQITYGIQEEEWSN